MNVAHEFVTAHGSKPRPATPPSGEPELATIGGSATSVRAGVVVQHEAWSEARQRILSAASAGVGTLVLIGAPGTGKTWLLRALAVELEQLGHEVTLVRQGELPWQLTPGGVLLIDEASRMNAQSLKDLVEQTAGLAVLAGLPEFAAEFEGVLPQPEIITLPTLGSEQMRQFVDAWVKASGIGETMFTSSAIKRLMVHSGGTPRLIAQLVGGTLALSEPSTKIEGQDVDEVAALRLGGIGYELSTTDDDDAAQEAWGAEFAYSGLAPRGFHWRRMSLLLSGLAASVMIGLLLGTSWTPSRSEFAALENAVVPLPSAAVTPAPATLAQNTPQQAARPSYPARVDLSPVDLAPVDRATADSAPAQLVTAQTVTAQMGRVPRIDPAQPVPIAMADIPSPEISSSPALRPVPVAQLMSPPPTPRLALLSPDMPQVTNVATVSPSALVSLLAPPLSATALPDLIVSEPSPLADPPRPAPSQFADQPLVLDQPPVLAQPSNAPIANASRDRRGGPGLILVARRGDTLKALYTNIYQGLHPPPFDAVLAANPVPFRPGAIVVFPEPPNGWAQP